MNDEPREDRPDPLAAQLLAHAQLLSQLRRDLDEIANVTTDVAADLLSRLDELESSQAPGRSPSAWNRRGLGPGASDQLTEGTVFVG